MLSLFAKSGWWSIPGDSPMTQRAKNHRLNAIESPTPFEWNGQKGSFQIFGFSQPWTPALVRVGLRTAGVARWSGSARIVSRPALQLEVNPQGWRLLELDESPYRDDFIVFTDSPKVLPVIVEPATVAACEGLRGLVKGAPVAILLTPFLVQVDQMVGPRDHRDHLRLVHAVISLVESLPSGKLPVPGTIEPHPAPAIDVSRARCEVCRSPLSPPYALCEGCVTPHHLDCWNYVGGCSTYACMRRRCQVFHRAADMAHLG